MARFVNRVLRSHVAHVLLAISWTFILLTYVPPWRTPRFVDCIPIGDEVYSYGAIVDLVHPIWTAVILVAHLPSLLATMGATKLIQRIFSLSCAPTARLEVPLLFLFSSVQWFLLGYTIESFFRRWRART